jgi:hypothetical protein
MVLARFFLPSVPGLAALIAALVVTVCARLPARWRNAAIASLALAIAAEPAANAAALVYRLGREDTRVLAGRWLDQHLPAEAAIGVGGAPALATHEWGGPVTTAHRLRRAPRPQAWKSAGLEYVAWHSYPLPYSALPLPAALRERSPIAVFDPIAGDAQDLVLEPLDAFYLPLAGLAQVERPGPRIAVYRLDPRHQASGETSPGSGRRPPG